MAFGLAESLAVAAGVATALIKGAALASWQKGAAGAALKWVEKAAGDELADRKRLAGLRKAASTAERWLATQPPSPARDLLAQAGPHKWPEVAGAIACLGADLDGHALRVAVAEALALGATGTTPAARAAAAELYVQALLRVLAQSRELGAVAGQLLAEARAARLSQKLDDVLAAVDPGRLSFTVGTLLAACHVQVARAVDAVDGRYSPDLYVPRSAEGAIAAALDAPRGNALGVALVAPPGVGKTNLVCHLARTRLDRQPVVVLRADAVGDGPEALHRAIRFALEGAHDGVRMPSDADALRALGAAGERLGRPALVLLDALDDHPDPGALRPALTHLLDQARHRSVRVLVACTESTWGAVADASLRARLHRVPGEDDPPLGAFDAGELRLALDRYFDAYGVGGNLAPGAAERIRHPALLRLLCEVYQGGEVGPGISLKVGALFDRYWDQTLDRAARRGWSGAPSAHDAREEALHGLLLDLATWLLDREARAIPSDALAALRPWAGDPGDAGSAVGGLVTQGVLARIPAPDAGTDPRVGFVFTELARYALGRALARRWRAAGLTEGAIHAEIDAHIATTAAPRTLAFALEHAGTRLWREAGIRLWPALLPHPGRWRRAGFAILSQLDPATLGPALDDALCDALVPDPAWAQPALDALKTPEVALHVGPDVHARVAGLLEHDALAVRRRAALALRHAPADIAAPALAARLRDRRAEVRWNATSALFTQRADGVAVLRRELLADAPTARADAARALGALCAHPRAGELWWSLSDAGADLLARLDDADGAVRAQALEALRAWVTRHGVEELPGTAAGLRARLGTALQDRNRHVRRAAADTLGELGTAGLGPGAPAALEAALQDAVAEVATAAAAALGACQRPECAPALRRALATAAAPETRAAAAASLGALTGPAAVPSLVAALEDSDAGVRAAAATTLAPLLGARSDTPDAPARLAALLDGERGEALAAALALADHAARGGTLEDSVRNTIFGVLLVTLDRAPVQPRLDALGRLGAADAVDHQPRIAAALRAANARVREAALVALGALGDPRSVPSIRQAVAAGRVPPDRADAILEQLERRGAERVTLLPIDALEARLSDPDTDSRAAAVAQLGRSTAPRAIAAIERALSDRHPVVRSAAVLARAAQGGPEAGPSLARALADPTAGVRRATAAALGGLDARPVPAVVATALRRALQDPHPRVRAAAARAIAGLALVDAAVAVRRLVRDPDTEVRDAANSARHALAQAAADADPDATTAPRSAR